MSLTTALFTGLTGMDVHTKSLDVIGNNIANVNTVGFKSSRALFETQLASNLNLGTAPSGLSGGTNPTQIGLGVKFAGTQRNFNNGSIQPTGVATDLALEGAGFFAVRLNTETLYTRNGSFDLNSAQQLVAPNGGIVQGFGVDDQFNIVPGVLQDMTIPVGTLTVAEATRNVELAGNLNASGAVATAGSAIESQALNDAAGGGPASAATLLTDLQDAAGGFNLFANGDVVTVQGVEKGGKALGTFTFEVGASNTTGADAFGTTFGDLTAFLEDVLGINPAVDGAGVGINAATGAIEINGNFGQTNDLSFSAADLISTGSPTQPLSFTKTADANGESVRTTFVAFDSLGTPLTVDLTVSLISRDSNGSTWRYYAESKDDTDADLVLGAGTLTFDTFGGLSGVSNPAIAIDRTNTGAVDPLTINLDFASTDNFTALTDTASTLAAVSQDGSPIGTLASFSIGEDGVVSGAFSNGLTRTLGQVALATFSNPEGLVDSGSNMFSEGPNSGPAVPVAPLTFGSGRVIAGALELSNVDLSQEFVNLITTNTGFSAATRVITTSDELLQQLLAISR